MKFPPARWIGFIAAVLIVLGSFGGGAIRYRGGVLDAVGLNFLSYGHGAGLSNVTVWCGVTGMVLAWIVLGKQVLVNTSLTSEEALRSMRHALLYWVGPLVCAGPILSRDVYSYLMQGAMLRDGFDPYTQGAAVNPGPFLLEVSHDWRNTTTPYGPLHLWIGDGITTLVGDNVTLGVLMYKLVSIGGFAAITWSTPLIARELGGSAPLALWLGVANPVMILHLVGGMHNESVMVGLVSVGILFALRRKLVLAVAAVSIGVSLKATAVFALPFIVWIGTRSARSRLAHYMPRVSERARTVVAFLLTGMWMALEFLVVMAAITYASGSNWGWVSQISGNAKVINPLALPSLIADLVTPVALFINPAFTYNSALAVSRPICGLIMVAGLVATWWHYRQNNRRNIMGLTAAYGFAVVFNSVTLPWYYTSLLNFVGTFRPSIRIIRVTTLLSIVVAVAFTGGGNHQLYNPVWMSVAFVAAWLATRYLFANATGSEPWLTNPVPRENAQSAPTAVS